MKHPNLLALAICLASTSAVAVEQGEYSLNGFGTAAISRLGGANDAHGYGISGQTTDSWRGDQLSKLGGQVRYGLTDQLSATAQAVLKPEQDEWKLNLEWAYLAYEFNEQMSVRAGRLRPNAFTFSETLDVGYSYPWLRLPDEVYMQMPINNFEGADALYSLPLSLGILNLQFSYGQAKDREIFIHPLDQRLDIDYKELLTASVGLATNELGTLRYSYTETDLVIEDGQPFKGKFTSIGHQYDNGTWVSNAEAIERRSVAGTNEAFYIMLGRHFGDFLPHVTYAQLEQQDAGGQNSWTYGLNYSLSPSVTLKSEYKRVEFTDAYRGFTGAFVRDYSSAQPTFDGDMFSVGADFVF